MLLSSIRVQGFKSFADKTTLKFGRGITAVVGPNGSGKSNISDAVRWVLGEQSTKSLRGQSMEDVIFGGTETRRPHGFCEVTLNIDNSDRSLNFDNDSVSITRRYYRSHESEYLINNVAVRLKDVHELFMDTGLGRDGYSMIGQGRIDSIIRSRSDERRDIFEEAAGISKYRYRKEDAERKLKAAEENLLRLKDIMDELESRVGPLAEQSRKAERFLELSEEKKKLEIGLWVYMLNNSKDALRSQESKISAAQLQYREIENALSEFDDLAEQNSSEFARITGEIENERAAIASVNEEIVKVCGNISVIENDKRHNNESVERLTAESQALSTSDVEARSEIDEKIATANQKEEAVKALEEKLSVLEQELSGLLSDSENISRKIEEQVRLLNTLTAQSADFRVEMMSANTSIDEITSRGTAVNSLIDENQKQFDELSAEFDETQKLLSSLEENITEYQNAIGGYELRLKRRQETLDELQNKCDEIHLDIESKKRRVQILNELENSMEGFSHAVKRVMSDSEKGILRGVHGTIAKIITVDKKYTVAVETALGNAIQNIVVDTEADAKRAIQYLKSNNAGRATFLPVSSITARDFKESGFESVYGYVGIASDLVSTDEKYRQILRYLLGGAVVTEDIDSAVTLAKKYNYRVKVVSLDGQVINPGGSLTGGSLVKQAGLLSRGADIKRLTDEIKKLEEKEKSLTDEKLEAAEKLSSVNADIAAVKADLTTANEDKIRTLAELKRLDDLRLGVKKSLNELISERDNAGVKIAELKTVAENAAQQIAELDIQKTKLQTEIDSHTSGRDDIAGKREEIAENITNIKLQIIEDKKDVQSLRANAEILEASIGTRAVRVAQIEQEIAALVYQNEQLQKDITEANDEIDEFKERIEKSNKLIEELISKRNDTEKAGVELRAGEKERTNERERIGGELARLCERKDIMIKEYEDVIRQLYDEYQLTRSEAEELACEIDKPIEAKRTLSEIKSKIRGLGHVNVSAIEEYKEVSERYNFMTEQINDVESSRAELYKLINQLTAQMQELFNVAFAKINENFSATFRDLFGGGNAKLSLSDPENVLNSGIDIEAKLPGKNVPSLEGLSGGEKALVALSIYFAIMQVNAPPFCFLDEVDTALDDINVDRFADYMRQSKLPTQFICVTHRRGTMEAADMLYGVTMQEKGVTKLLELDVAQLEKKLLQEQNS
ncbi:MAG: chromosome segregation protein SMC [Ruminococcaceae bacterium]|nr:chromosome segregation protein SMC [Oscillospiraceae bacterium]